MVLALMLSVTFTVVPLPLSTLRVAVIPSASILVHPSNQLLEAENAPRKVVWVRKVVSASVSAPERAGLLDVGYGARTLSEPSASVRAGSASKELLLPEADS